MKILKQVCLLMNLGGFETRMAENYKIASECAHVIYAMTGDGLVNVSDAVSCPVPVNVLSLTPAELDVWSSVINDELSKEGLTPESVIILAAGRKYRGTLPLGSNLIPGVKLGA